MSLAAPPGLGTAPSRPARSGRPADVRPTAPPARRRRRLPPRPRRRVVDVLTALAGLGLGVVIALGVSAESYGAFTADHRTGDRILLIGAGVGSTPIRALLQELPPDADVIAILRASTIEELALREEIVADVAARGGRVHELVGPRAGIDLSASGLVRLAPDLPGRDVFVCGPGGFTSAVVAAARDAGVPREQIHQERFDF